MKRLLQLLCYFVLASSLSSAQTYDEKIANAMNSGDWFALDSVYHSAPKDSIHGFLEVYARCLIGNRLNRPDVSIPAFDELLNTKSAELDLGNLISASMMFAMDLSRTNDNATASSMLTSILDATRQHLDSATSAMLQSYENQYAALSKYRPYSIDFGQQTEAQIPFRYMPVGPKDKGAVLMRLDQCSINGNHAEITFDTGAGVNIISYLSAQKLGLIPLDASSTVCGFGLQSGSKAIAKELKIGPITITDVPFTVIHITSNNEEANKYINALDIVVGSELMLQLKDLTIDFSKQLITVPSVAPARSTTPSNICFSSSMNLLTKGTVNDNKMLMNIDTGDASYGTLNKQFYEANKEFVSSCPLDTVRTAGIGGVHISQCYRVPDMTAQLGGSTVTIPEMTVQTQDNPSVQDYECNFGLQSLRLFSKIRFNLVDFTLTTYPYSLSLNTQKTSSHNIPTFTVTNDKGMTPLQAIGCIAVGVGKVLLNQNGSDNPDL